MTSDIFLESPPSVRARPAGLASLGPRSYFVEPYFIRSPHRVHIGRDVEIGAGASLSVVVEEGDAQFDPVVRIGDGCRITHSLYLSCVAEVVIGANVVMSARVSIGDIHHEYRDRGSPIKAQGMSPPAPVRICDGAGIGAGAMIAPGVTVGENAYVAAGAVVAIDVPARCVAFGNPARVVRSWDIELGAWIEGPPRDGSETGPPVVVDDEVVGGAY